MFAPTSLYNFRGLLVHKTKGVGTIKFLSQQKIGLNETKINFLQENKKASKSQENKKASKSHKNIPKKDNIKGHVM